jgi:hypothetical protein
LPRIFARGVRRLFRATALSRLQSLHGKQIGKIKEKRLNQSGSAFFEANN